MKIEKSGHQYDTRFSQTRIPNFETCVRNVETCVRTVETRIRNVETCIRTVETCIRTVETCVPNVETRIRNVETRIRNFETLFPNFRIPIFLVILTQALLPPSGLNLCSSTIIFTATTRHRKVAGFARKPIRSNKK